MGRELLDNLIFADDIALIAESPGELENMLNNINTTSRPVGKIKVIHKGIRQKSYCHC